MSDIFQELEKMGFANIGQDNLFRTPGEREKKKVEEKHEIEEWKEEDYLFDKKYECPICDHHFTERTVRVGKARHIKTDYDLHPRYKGIDPLKYDVVVCPKCGYAALAKSFVQGLTSLQRRLIREKVQANFKGIGEQKMLYTYADAIVRYKMALYSSVVKMAKNSERAYICLKIAWMYRSIREELEETNGDKAKIKEYEEEEIAYIQRAFEGFDTAMKQEMFPICGMDENTFDYLYAVLALKAGKEDIAKRLIGNLMVSKSASHAVKERARRLKEELMDKKNE